MGFIFYMSSFSGEASNEKSFAVVKSVTGENKVMNQTKLPETPTDKRINLFIRKNAHALEFLVLAILVGNSLFINNVRGKAFLFIIMFICLFYAVLDEFHQSFVPSRSALVNDVLIDFAGSLIGIGVHHLVPGGQKWMKNGYSLLYIKSWFWSCCKKHSYSSGTA
jgi:VanZ family protein